MNFEYHCIGSMNYFDSYCFVNFNSFIINWCRIWKCRNVVDCLFNRVNNLICPSLTIVNIMSKMNII